MHNNLNELLQNPGDASKYSRALTNSIWLMKRDDPRPLSFHGANIPDVQRILFERYTKPGDLVIDWFLGSGTSAMVALETGRKIIGIDLQYRFQEATGPDFKFIWANAMDIWTGETVLQDLPEMGHPDGADFAFIHPPYWDIIQFTDEVGDLSLTKTLEEFRSGLRQVASNAIKTLKHHGWAALLIGDKYEDGEWIPLSYYLWQEMVSVGFKPKGEIIKDMSDNEAKGRNGALWHHRHLLNGTVNFGHEKIFLFRKESK